MDRLPAYGVFIMVETESRRYRSMNDGSETVRVLHVDDNQEFVEVASIVLERERETLTVETATSVDEGLDRLSEFEFDCLVSDYDLVERTGIDFLEAVREEYPDVPFILFTGKGSEEVAADAFSAGATDYIQKKGGTSQYTVLANRIENLVTQYRARRRSERANRRRRRTLERITDGFVEMDAEFTITDLNAHAVELAGSSREELVGTEVRELMVADSSGRFLDAYREVLRTGDPQTVEAPSDISPDRWIEERIFPIQEGGDGIFAYFRDITDRKRRERLQTIIIETSSRLIDVTEGNIDDRIVETLQRIGEFEGADRCYVFQVYDDGRRMDNTHEWCAPGVASQQPELQRLSTADFSWFMPRIEAFETVTVPDVSDLPGEAEYLRTTLESGNIESIVTIPLTRGGRLLGFIGFDWTEEQEPWSEDTIDLLEVSGNIIANALARKGTIAERRAREETLSALHDTAAEIGRADDPTAVYGTLIDAADRILDLDYAAVDVERDGYLVQVGLVDSDPGSYYERVSLADEDTFAARAYNRQETIVVDDVLDTCIVPANAEFRSVLTVPIGEFGTFQTVSTEPAAFDDQDREFVELLVDHARVKLDQLQDKRTLREQTRELEDKNERLEEFATLVSHDLRNPLNTLTLSLDPAEQTGEPEHFDRARRAADRIDTLLEDLLALALQGKEIDDRELVPLDEAAETACQTVETDDGRLTVETTATIDADPTRLGEVLENLIRNGVEHGSTGSRTGGDDPVEHGTPPVEITVGDCPGGFYVADDGPGIPADRREEVFETGYSTADDGTGFGLAIVEEIVEAHGWEITVTESEAGGARFEITGVDVR
jgi:PAS domain S-box-containing protein